MFILELFILSNLLNSKNVQNSIKKERKKKSIRPFRFSLLKSRNFILHLRCDNITMKGRENKHQTRLWRKKLLGGSFRILNEIFASLWLLQRFFPVDSRNLSKKIQQEILNFLLMSFIFFCFFQILDWLLDISSSEVQNLLVSFDLNLLP